MTKVANILSYIMSHLRSRRWCTIIVLDHTVVELGWHGNDHVIVVRVEITALWYIKTEWWSIVISSQQVVGIVSKTRLHETGFGQVWWPNSLVSVLSLMDRHVWWPNSVINLTLTEVPLLEVI
jgi:hypothetical protein